LKLLSRCAPQAPTPGKGPALLRLAAIEADPAGPANAGHNGKKKKTSSIAPCTA